MGGVLSVPLPRIKKKKNRHNFNPSLDDFEVHKKHVACPQL